MRKIIVSKDSYINGVFYEKGQEIKDLDYKGIVQLNEKGFIQPLDLKELNSIKEELNKNSFRVNKEENREAEEEN